MVDRFRDHAANERTFLAWVRTAIAMMAFGFVVEKFDLFLAVMAPQSAGQTLSFRSEGFGRWAGLGIIFFGVIVVGISATRFLRAGRAIEQDTAQGVPGFDADIGLAVTLVLVGLAIILYLSHLSG
jgi:putative membrane protein